MKYLKSIFISLLCMHSTFNVMCMEVNSNTIVCDYSMSPHMTAMDAIDKKILLVTIKEHGVIFIKNQLKEIKQPPVEYDKERDLYCIKDPIVCLTLETNFYRNDIKNSALTKTIFTRVDEWLDQQYTQYRNTHPRHERWPIYRPCNLPVTPHTTVSSLINEYGRASSDVQTTTHYYDVDTIQKTLADGND